MVYTVAINEYMLRVYTSREKMGTKRKGETYGKVHEHTIVSVQKEMICRDMFERNKLGFVWG